MRDVRRVGSRRPHEHEDARPAVELPEAPHRAGQRLAHHAVGLRLLQPARVRREGEAGDRRARRGAGAGAGAGGTSSAYFIASRIAASKSAASLSAMAQALRGTLVNSITCVTCSAGGAAVGRPRAALRVRFAVAPCWRPTRRACRVAGGQVDAQLSRWCWCCCCAAAGDAPPPLVLPPPLAAAPPLLLPPPPPPPVRRRGIETCLRLATVRVGGSSRPIFAISSLWPRGAQLELVGRHACRAARDAARARPRSRVCGRRADRHRRGAADSVPPRAPARHPRPSDAPQRGGAAVDVGGAGDARRARQKLAERRRARVGARAGFRFAPRHRGEAEGLEDDVPVDRRRLCARAARAQGEADRRRARR